MVLTLKQTKDKAVKDCHPDQKKGKASQVECKDYTDLVFWCSNDRTQGIGDTQLWTRRQPTRGFIWRFSSTRMRICTQPWKHGSSDLWGHDPHSTPFLSCQPRPLWLVFLPPESNGHEIEVICWCGDDKNNLAGVTSRHHTWGVPKGLQTVGEKVGQLYHL